MLRIGFVLAIWVVLVGGLSVYMQNREALELSHGEALILRPAAGIYSIEVTPSFAAESDPFALNLDETDKAPAILLRLGNTELLRKSGGIEAGFPIRLENITGIVEGSNEVYVSAAPPGGHPQQRHFVQLRVLRDGNEIATTILSSEGGATVAGSLLFQVHAAKESAHDH